LRFVPDAEATAVGSRTLASASAFAQRHGISRAHGSWQELAEDPEVDVIYVATPHQAHHEAAMTCLRAGKAVLCEKPFTLDLASSEELVETARSAGLFLMEAMWMRCNPLIRRLQQLLGSGRLGAVRQVRADLGFVVDKPPTDRLLDPALGGGALLDTGIYPLTFASLFLGEPSGVAAVAALSDQGVDLNLAVALAYDSGAVASLTSSMTALSPRNASVATDRGRLDFPAPFHHPTTVTWTPLEPDPGASPEPQELHEDLLGRGYTHEALEVARCLRNGEVESPLVPLDDTVALMRQMDTIRAQVGVRYPADDPG
jgi:predicted dehydrogenase